MTSKNPHTALIKEILEFYQDHETVILWKNQSGVAFRGKYLVGLAPKGSPDIVGLTTLGKFVGIEVKTGNAKLNKDQKEFRDRIEELGGIYGVARSLNDVILIIKNLGPTM